MRLAQTEMNEQVTEIVGRISNFGNNLEEIGQKNLPYDIENAYEISKQIIPGNVNLNLALQKISNFIKPLSNDVMTRFQNNIPEKDNTSSAATLQENAQDFLFN